MYLPFSLCLALNFLQTSCEWEWKILSLVLNYDLDRCLPWALPSVTQSDRIDKMWWMSSPYFSVSICCWPLLETADWACWAYALLYNKCYFLRNSGIPLPLEQRGVRKGNPTHLGCCNTSCVSQGEGLWLASRAFVLLLFTKGLMVVCALFLSAMYHFFSRQAALANVFILYHAYVSKNIRENERQINQVVFWIRTRNWKEKKKVRFSTLFLKQNACS